MTASLLHGNKSVALCGEGRLFPDACVSEFQSGGAQGGPIRLGSEHNDSHG